jgi:hypothetical protein
MNIRKNAILLNKLKKYPRWEVKSPYFCSKDEKIDCSRPL